MGLLVGQVACFSPAPYRPGDDTSVTLRDPNTASSGMMAPNANDIAQSAALASTTLHVAPDAAPPANTADLLANPNAMASIDSNDFVALTQAFAILYNNDPAAYYVTLGQVLDGSLRGAIHYGINDTLDYHSVTLRDNGGTAEVETAQFATYQHAATANAALYAAWAVPFKIETMPALTLEDPAQLPSVASLIPEVSNHAAIVAAIAAAAPANAHGVDGAAFAQLVIALTPMYQTSLAKYYQVLTQIADKHLRDVVNFTITDAVANHPTLLTQSDGGASTFASASWPYYNQVGFVGSAQVAMFQNIVLDTAGPLQGKPYLAAQ